MKYVCYPTKRDSTLILFPPDASFIIRCYDLLLSVKLGDVMCFGYCFPIGGDDVSTLSHVRIDSPDNEPNHQIDIGKELAAPVVRKVVSNLLGCMNEAL